MMKKDKINEDLQEDHTLYEYRGQTLDVGVVVTDFDGNSS